ncbi:Transcription elongation factor, TFIIS/CRSP70 [Artemisia annua]|uniref:Transcription elongation factor, TFIIS/CRSP70 n=1 Tax=Artemisia annua TaxID=35608 RepID=A0A2U1N0Q5_ARTAN|nr:Transcription elongation factor, TFIIS/CRSP70 [Artemisia annua]
MSCEEKKLVKEVLRIKAFLDEKVGDDECGSWVAYQSLRKLQQMVLSVKVLKETMIGESVGVYLKHASKDVSRVSRFLMNEWRCVVDEWVEANEKKTSLDQKEMKKDVKITEPQRPRVVRIKLKTKSESDNDNVVPKGPITHEKKVGNNNGIDEVLRIKGVIKKSIGDESESQSTLLDSLKKLQHMDISIETLDKTGIGKTVNAFKKHVYKDVSQLARMLVKTWKDMAEEWIKKDISNVKPISEQAKNHKGLVTHGQHCQPIDSDATTSDQKSLVVHGQHSRPIDSDAATSDHKGLSNTTEEKMESTKKRLEERYKELENMKQKRKIQVIEHYELPRNSRLPPKAQHVKPVNERVKR